jgi:hypothetical protein
LRFYGILKGVLKNAAYATINPVTLLLIVTINPALVALGVTMPLLKRKIPCFLNVRSVETLLSPFIPVIKTPVIYLWDGIRYKKIKIKKI